MPNTGKTHVHFKQPTQTGISRLLDYLKLQQNFTEITGPKSTFACVIKRPFQPQHSYRLPYNFDVASTSESQLQIGIPEVIMKNA